jgi:hypothetical protein
MDGVCGEVASWGLELGWERGAGSGELEDGENLGLMLIFQSLKSLPIVGGSIG